MDLWVIERELSANGYKTVCGVDEAGRGPLAGPVFAAAVILPIDAYIPGLNDSKKLTAKRRDSLFDEIVEKALAYGIATADHREIDDVNILKATFLCMCRSVDLLPIKPDYVLVDGNSNPFHNYQSRCVIGGDGKSASIAAASILAKVSRDWFMTEMSKKYPQYGFEQHKGYGTKLHYEKLREFGPSEIHRATFLRRFLDDG